MTIRTRSMSILRRMSSRGTRMSRRALVSSVGFLGVVYGLLGQAAAPPVAAQAPTEQPCRRSEAFQATELEEALTSGAPPGAVARLVAACGTAFTLDADITARLRKAGGNESLLAAIRKMSPPADAAVGARWTSPLDGAEMVLAGSEE